MWAAAPAAQAGLLNHWKLDETSGSTAVDSGSGANDGTITGATTNQPGKIGQAYSFDGAGDWVVMTGYKGITGKASRSMTAWIKTDGTGGDGTNGRGVIGWGQDTAGKRWSMVVNKQSAGGRQVNATRINVNSGTRTGTTVVTDDQWRLLAVTLLDDGSPNAKEIQMYVDGVAETFSHTLGEPINTGSTADVRIGRGVKTSSFGWFQGLIDDVTVWDEQLSPGEIRGLFDVADNAALNYDAGQFALLKEVHDAGGGSVIIGGLDWGYASGLPGSNGLSGGPQTFTLVLDEQAGTGLVGQPAGDIPEPATAGLLALTCTALGGYIRRRRQA